MTYLAACAGHPLFERWQLESAQPRGGVVGLPSPLEYESPRDTTRRSRKFGLDTVLAVRPAASVIVTVMRQVPSFLRTTVREQEEPTVDSDGVACPPVGTKSHR